MTEPMREPMHEPAGQPAPYAPIAVMSVTANIAVGGCFSDSRWSIAWAPPSSTKPDSTRRSGSAGIPASAKAAW